MDPTRKRISMPTGRIVDFNARKPPPGYVPGLGRGASGFTTRSDLGPALPQATDTDARRTRQESTEKEADGSREESGPFDRFMGNDMGALAGRPGEYDEDDREADAVWKRVDESMDERRRSRREAKMEEEIRKKRMEQPQISTMFRDLKRQLAEVPPEAWDAIPDVGDYTIKKQKLEKFAPPPDTLLAKAVAEKASLAQLDPEVLRASEGTREGSGIASASADLTSIAEGRGTVLSLQLDRASDSVSGQTVVDPKGYLTDLQGIKLRSDADVADLKKARLLLKSIVATNPGHGPGWIAAARLEEVAGRVSVARQLIKRGCEACPKNEDVWLEAARLAQPADAALILARGVSIIPRSVPLWMRAASLEKETSAKARVLRKALEHVPESVALWKNLIELADRDDARVLLSRAVECCPRHVDLWLALTRLQGYEDARKTLNRARATIPTEPSIWFAAARLEEAKLRSEQITIQPSEQEVALRIAKTDQPSTGTRSNLDNVVWKIVSRGVSSLAKHGVEVDRDRWLREAVACEKAQTPSPSTCRALVKAAIGIGVDPADARRTFVADAEEQARGGAHLTSLAIFDCALEAFPEDEELWQRAAQLRMSRAEEVRKACGKPESSASLQEEEELWSELHTFLQQAVNICPKSSVLWLLAASAKKKKNSIKEASDILDAGICANPQSQDIFLAAFALKFEQKDDEGASSILQRARENLQNVPMIWEMSALLERITSSTFLLKHEKASARTAHESELALVLEGLKRYPFRPALHRMRAELLLFLGRGAEAKEALRFGIKQCGKVAVQEEVNAETPENQRSVGERRSSAELDLPPYFALACTGYWATTAPLWIMLSDLELEGGSLTRARAALEQGRKAKPHCPELWIAAVRLENKSGDHGNAEALISLALKALPSSGLLWAECLSNTPRVQRKSKAADALGRCPEDGSIIAAVASFFALERKDEKARSWFQRAAVASPMNGDIWAMWLSFENRRGQENKAEAVRSAFLDQNTTPVQGEFWIRNAILPQNARRSLVELLEEVAQTYLKEKTAV